MKRMLLSMLTILALLLSGCSALKGDVPKENDRIIVATTYPVYLFAKTVVGNTEGVFVTRLDTGEISCLHDYTLTVNDMKLLEQADVIVMNGVGLEDFMSDALATSSATVIDCSEGVELLEAQGHDKDDGHDDHDHGHYDPHIWMNPNNALIMIQNIATALETLDPDRQQGYQENADAAEAFMHWGNMDLTPADAAGVYVSSQTGLYAPTTGEISWDLITFHDGFQYFAQAFDMTLLKSIEEEEGSEASAQEINEIIALIKEYDLPAIFTEVNGSDATANAIARETGVEVYHFDMIMDGDGQDLSDYRDRVTNNFHVFACAYLGLPMEAGMQ